MVGGDLADVVIRGVTTLITGGVAGGGVFAWLNRRADRKIEEGVNAAKVSSDLIQTLMSRIQQLEERTDNLEKQRRRDALLIRAQGDHIDLLENHIWTKQPPPPPPRPSEV